MSDNEDYMDIEVPDLDDDGKVRVPSIRDDDFASTKLSGKFGIAAVAISVLAIGGQMIAPVLGIPPTVWAYFPFLWVIAAGLGIWGFFADDKKSLDFFAVVGSVLFGIPTIVLSIDLLNTLNT